MEELLKVTTRATSGGRTHLKIHLINGSVRSIKCTERVEMQDIVRLVVSRINADASVVSKHFSIRMQHERTGEAYWLAFNLTLGDVRQRYESRYPREEWRYVLRIRFLPRSIHELLQKDPVTFQYFYDQVKHDYMTSSVSVTEHEIAIQLGCLEMRRFFKHMPQAALAKKSNFDFLEKEVGLAKFIPEQVLEATRSRKLQRSILSYFKQFASLDEDACMIKYFEILSKHRRIDTDKFECEVGSGVHIPVTVFVGPTQGISYITEQSTSETHMANFYQIREVNIVPVDSNRTAVRIDYENGSEPIVITCLSAKTAYEMATLVDGYCHLYANTRMSVFKPIEPDAYRSSVASYSSIKSATAMVEEASRMLNAPPLPDTLRPKLPRAPASTPPTPTNARKGRFSQLMADTSDYAEVLLSEDKEGLYSEPMAAKAWAVERSKVILGPRVGEGQFGDVHKGTMDGKEVAVKTCKDTATKEEMNKFMEEATTMEQFSHPHIIKLLGIVIEKPIYIIMEFAQLGELRSYLLDQGMNIQQTTLVSYCYQISSALSYLESKKFVHRDIAARNCLVSSPEIVKLADFGLSRWVELNDYYKASRGKLPIKWMAPESINFRKFSGASDVWMFGVCAWEIMSCGVKPFFGVKNNDVIGKIEDGERLALPTDCPPNLYRLMNDCWEYESSNRPSFVDVKRRIYEILGYEKKFIDDEKRKDARRPPLTKKDSYGSLPPPKPNRSTISVPKHSNKSSPFDRKRSLTLPGPTSFVRSRSDGPPDQVGSNLSENGTDLIRKTSQPSIVSEQYDVPRKVSAEALSERGNRPLSTSAIPVDVVRLHHSPSSDSVRSHDSGMSNDSTSDDQEMEERKLQKRRERLEMERTERLRREQLLRNQKEESSKDDQWLKQSERHSTYSVSAQVAAQLVEKAIQDKQSGLRVKQLSTSDDPSGAQTPEWLNEPSNPSSPVADSPHSSHSPTVCPQTIIANAIEATREAEQILEGSSHSRSASPGSTGSRTKNSPSPVSNGSARLSQQLPVSTNDKMVSRTSEVVRAVIQMSTDAQRSRAETYLIHAKKIGIAVRNLLEDAHNFLMTLPLNMHKEIQLAHAVVVSDMAQLVQKSKTAVENKHTMMIEEYSRGVLGAAHSLAQDARTLLEAVQKADL